MRLLLLARHAEAASNLAATVNGVPPGGSLSPAGREQAQALGRALADAQVDLCVTSEFARARETAELALAERSAPRLVLPELNEIGFGSYEGDLLSTYRDWAWVAPPEEVCPGGGESRSAFAARLASGFDALLRRDEETLLAITHALAVRYVVDAAHGLVPKARMLEVPQAEPFRLDAEPLERAAGMLAAWSQAPTFRSQ